MLSNDYGLDTFNFPYLMANKVFLFTGEERFLLQQELKRWTSAFAEKHGMENLFVIRSDAFDLSVIKQALGG